MSGMIPFNALIERYRQSLLMVFVVLIGATLCFGRAFAVQKLFVISGVPLYTTDLFFLLALPAALLGLVQLRRALQNIFWPFMSMFLLGSVYLIEGVLFANKGVALRGIVLSGYLLFIPVVWFMCARVFRARTFFLVLTGFGLFSMAIAYLLFCRVQWDSPVVNLFFSNMRDFNAALSCGILIAFFLPYGLEKGCGWAKWLAWIFCGVNVYLIIMSGVRSSWVALIMAMLFFAVIYVRKWKDLLMAFCVIGLIVASLFLVVNLKLMPFYGQSLLRQEKLWKKVEMAGLMASEFRPFDAHEYVISPRLKEARERDPNMGEAYDNIHWRVKLWRGTFMEGMKSPLWGNGFGHVLMLDFLRKPLQAGSFENSGITPPHNEFLTLFYKMGALGVLVFLWLNATIFIWGLKTLQQMTMCLQRACLAGALGALVVWHVMALFYDVLDSPSTNILLWILLGYVLVIAQYQSQQREGPCCET